MELVLALIFIVLAYIFYLVLKDINSDHPSFECGCSGRCSCQNTQKNTAQPKYTYTATKNKTTSF